MHDLHALTERQCSVLTSDKTIPKIFTFTIPDKIFHSDMILDAGFFLDTLVIDCFNMLILILNCSQQKMY